MIIIKPSFMIAATVAALAISVWTGGEPSQERDSPGDSKLGGPEKRGEETGQVRLLAKELRERKAVLERRLLELYDARGEYRLIRRILREKCSEAELLNSKVCMLRAEKDALKEELRKSGEGQEELRSARRVIMGLQERIDSRNKELRAVEERVDDVWRNNVRCDAGVGIGNKEKDAASDLEIEVLELQRVNEELKLETRELAFKLDAAWVRIAELLSGIEKERGMIPEFKKEAALLGRGNEDLRKMVDRLQKQRFEEVEELVYMRWLNICLRFEAEEFYEISQKNPMDSPHCSYRREWSAEYIDKTRRILTAVSTGSDSSRTSMETREHGASSAESTTSSSDNGKRNTLIHRIKHWGRGKKIRNGNSWSLSDQNAMEGRRRIRRFSSSMIPGPRATTESPGTTRGLSRLRRVSFNDALRTSEPLFRSTATSPRTPDVAGKPDVITVDKTDPNSSSGRADNSSKREQEVAETYAAEEVATGAGICEMFLVMMFLVLVLIMTLYYKIS